MSKMMGEQQRAESLFYYFRLEDQIDSARNIRRLSTENGEQRVILKAMDDCTDAE
jgi:hypothetical protein